MRHAVRVDREDQGIAPPQRGLLFAYVNHRSHHWVPAIAQANLPPVHSAIYQISEFMPVFRRNAGRFAPGSAALTR
jgi:hypothetical protein